MSNTAAKWLNRAVYLLTVLLIVGPAFIIPPLAKEGLKVGTELYVVLVAWALVATIGAARGLEGRSFLGGGEGSLFRRLMIAFAAWVVLSSLWSVRPDMHWEYGASVIAFLLAGQSLVGWMEGDPRRRQFVVGSIGVLVGVEVVLAMIQYGQVPLRKLKAYVAPGGYLENWIASVGPRAFRRAVTGSLGNPNYLGEFLALTTPVVVAFAFTRRRLAARVAFAAVAVAGVFALVATGARASLAGTFLGLGIAFVATKAWRDLDLRAWWAQPRKRAALLIVTAVLVIVAGVASNRMMTKLSRDLGADDSLESRLVNWKAAGTLLQAKPVQGYGVGSWKVISLDELRREHPQGLPGSSSRARFIQLHNEPLQAAMELGFVGFLLLLGALLAWTREVARNETLAPVERVGLIWSLYALLAASCFGFPFHIPLTALLVVVVLALGLARPTDATAAVPDAAANLEPRLRLPYALVILALVGGVAWVAVERSVLPAYRAAHYALLAEGLAKRDRRATGVDVLYAYAAETDRYSAPHVYDLMIALMREKKYAEAVAVFDKYAADGYNMSSRLVRGQMLMRLSKKDEAIADLQAVVHYYDRGDNNYRLAWKALKRLGVDAPAPEARKVPDPRRPVPASSPKPSSDDDGASKADEDRDDAASEGEDATGDAGAS